MRPEAGSPPRDTITAVPTIFVDDPADPRLADFRTLADAVALGQRGLFIVEGRLVVERLLRESPVEPCAVLVTVGEAAEVRKSRVRRVIHEYGWHAVIVSRGP